MSTHKDNEGDGDFTVGSGAGLGRLIHDLEEQVRLLKEQLRVADVCSDYHMKRSFMLLEANENANKVIGALADEIDRFYNKKGTENETDS